MREAVEQCAGQAFGTEHAGPLVERKPRPSGGGSAFRRDRRISTINRLVGSSLSIGACRLLGEFPERPRLCRLLKILQVLASSRPAVSASLPISTTIDISRSSKTLDIGLFDMLGSVQQAVCDPQWLGLAAEGYVFAACIFFMFCMMLSTMSKSIEPELDPSLRR